MFDRLEAAGYFLRLDPRVRPAMFHGATISEAELAALRQIENVVRRGRVTALGRNRIEFGDGELPTGPDFVHVDCSASAIRNLVMRPVFEGRLITPQTVRPYQPVFSAAFIAHIEATRDDEAEMNRLCSVVPLPNHDTDYLRFTAASMINQQAWAAEPGLRAWLLANRLDGFSRLVAGVRENETDKLALLGRLRHSAGPAMLKLQQFIAELDRPAAPGDGHE